MKEIAWQDVINGKQKIAQYSSVTIGVFDGLHRGHRVLIERIVHNPGHYLPLVVTFKQNPAKILHNANFPGDILTAGQKMTKLESLGVCTVVLIDFSHNFSRISAETFFSSLIEAFTIREMVVGYNFHFGYAQGADVNALKKWTEKKRIALEIMQPVTYAKRIVSSTRIREAIHYGMFDKAKAMLGDEYVLHIPVKSITRRADDKVYITRDLITQILPEQGRYLCTYNPSKENMEGEVKLGNKELICKVEDDIRLESLCFIKHIV
jgi:riboflavin kinase/FMN adenylyltransferase